jgi:pyruvate/2-oxoacid:ferredoxin oxidoreductase alpha subunit
MDPLYFYEGDENNDDEYYMPKSSKDVIKKLIKLLYPEKTNIDYTYRLEEVDYYDLKESSRVIKRNMDKFDRLTDQGYRLNFFTGEFTLSS